MRALSQILCLTFAAIALSASPANAGIGLDSNPVAAIDGTDVYGYTEYENRFGDKTEIVLHRKSILDGKTVKLATFDPSYARIYGVEAGGGRVAVELDYRTDLEYVRTRVLAMNRDGRDRRVLASVKSRQVYDDNKPRTDCGSSVNLESATSSGSFILTSLRSTRRGKPCGRKPDVDHWKYVEVSAQGKRRVLYSAKLAVTGKWSLSPLAEVVVNGDYAALVTRKTQRVHLKNLTTGVQTGPFIDSVRLSGAKLLFNLRVSLGPGGLLAIESGVDDQTSIDPPRWMDVFPDPMQPRLAARSDRLYEAQFCGSRLINGVPGNGVPGSPDEKATIREFDPRTLAETRRIATIPEYASIVSCSEDVVVIESRSNGKLKFRAIPIGQ